MVEQAYGAGVAEIFLIALPVAIVTLIAIAFVPATKLGTKTGIEQFAEKEAELLIDTEIADAGGVPVGRDRRENENDPVPVSRG